MKATLFGALIFIACQVPYSASFDISPEDQQSAAAILAETFQGLQNILRAQDLMPQNIAQKEAYWCKEPVTAPVLLYNYAEKVIALLPSRVDYVPNKFDALRTAIKNDQQFLTNWFNTTDVTGLGVAWKLFYPKGADTTGKKYYQFVFTTTNKSQEDILKKGAAEFRDKMDILHTSLRKRHGSKALTLIDETQETEKITPKGKITQGAQEYADILIASGKQEHSPDVVAKRCGENLAFQNGTGALAFGASAAEFASYCWYDEILLYDKDFINRSMLKHFGHFSQMTWRENTEWNPRASYGAKTVGDKKMNYLAVVARYYKGGNVFEVHGGAKLFYENVEFY